MQQVTQALRRGGALGRFLAAISDRYAEWFSAACMIAWGIALAMPGDTLAGPNFIAFRRFGISEDTWAAVFLVIGVARMITLFLNGRWPTGPYVRMAGSLFGALSWAQVSLLLFLGTYLPTGIMQTGPLIYALLAGSDLLSIFRASFDARYSDHS